MAFLILEHGFAGPYNAGFYDVKLPNGEVRRISGGHASMISMILAGYEFRSDFRVLEAFEQEPLARADMKVASGSAGGTGA